MCTAETLAPWFMFSQDIHLADDMFYPLIYYSFLHLFYIVWQHCVALSSPLRRLCSPHVCFLLWGKVAISPILLLLAYSHFIFYLYRAGHFDSTMFNWILIFLDFHLSGDDDKTLGRLDGIEIGSLVSCEVSFHAIVDNKIYIQKCMLCLLIRVASIKSYLRYWYEECSIHTCMYGKKMWNCFWALDMNCDLSVDMTTFVRYLIQLNDLNNGDITATSSCRARFQSINFTNRYYDDEFSFRRIFSHLFWKFWNTSSVKLDLSEVHLHCWCIHEDGI